MLTLLTLSLSLAHHQPQNAQHELPGTSMSRSWQVTAILQTHTLVRAILQKPATALALNYHSSPRSQLSPAKGPSSLFFFPAFSLSSLPPLLPVFHFLPNFSFLPSLNWLHYLSSSPAFHSLPPSPPAHKENVVSSALPYERKANISDACPRNSTLRVLM